MLWTIAVVLGVPGLAYGNFSYMKQTQDIKVGPIEMSVKEKETVNIPVWAGVGAIAIGTALLLPGGRKPWSSFSTMTRPAAFTDTRWRMAATSFTRCHLKESGGDLLFLGDGGAFLIAPLKNDGAWRCSRGKPQWSRSWHSLRTLPTWPGWGIASRRSRIRDFCPWCRERRPYETATRQATTWM
jgi:hypothetical protein